MTPEKNSSIRKEVNKAKSKVAKNFFQVGLAASMLLGSPACVPTEAISIIPTGETNPLPSDFTNTPESPTEANYKELTRTVENPATEAVTLTPEPTPVYEVQASGGEYNPSQETINESESAMAQKDRIQGWLDYWINFENRPFAWESTELHWKYIYDNPDEPKEVMVVLEALGEYEGRMFTSPLGEDGFALYPPEITAETDNFIQPGYGPLELSSGSEDLWLSIKAGVPLRKNVDGEVVGRLDMKTGQWEENKPLSQEFLALIPADKQYKIISGQVLIDGQIWFEINNDGEWQKTDWKLIQDAPNQEFWEKEYKVEGILRQDIWPVLTGENLEVVKEINDQQVLIKGKLVVIPNPYQQDEILKILIPYRYEWGNSLSNNVWIVTKTEEKSIDYFLQLVAGEQLRVAITLDSLKRPTECTFGTRCGWWYDIADLSTDFFFNGITPDEPVIVSPVYIEVK